MLNSYAPVKKFDCPRKNEVLSWGNLFNLPVMPISLQYDNIQNYIINKTKYRVNTKTQEDENNSDDEMVGKLTKKERREKIQRY